MKFETLGNMLGPEDTLKIDCPDCGHRAVLAARVAIRTFGASAPPYDVRARARCGRCGGGRVAVYI